MSDDKRYYYLKLKENFFDSEEIKILEALENGYLYSNILLKMYLKSLKNEGRLALRENIPYNEKMLAIVTGHNVDIVRQAIENFLKLGLVQQLDSGAIYIADIQSYIGESSSEADRKREYRLRIESEQKNPDGTFVRTFVGRSSPEIEIEIKKETELKPKKDIKAKNPPLSYSESFLDVWNNIYPHGIDRGSKDQAYRNWLVLLQEDKTEQELLSAASNYRKYCDIKHQQQFKYKCSNFYGKAKYYEGFIVLNEQQIINEVANENNPRLNKPLSYGERCAKGADNILALCRAFETTEDNNSC